MELKFRENDGVVVLTYDQTVVNDDVSFEAWREAVNAGVVRMYEQLGGRYPLAICIDGLTLSRRYGERYSTEIAQHASEYVSAIARFGAAGRTTAVIAIEAHNRVNRGMPFATDERYTANLFTSEQEAVEFLRDLTR